MKDLILKLLVLIPEPHVQLGAAALAAILAQVRDHPAAANEEDLADTLTLALAAARDPFVRIKVRAAWELGDDAAPTE